MSPTPAQVMHDALITGDLTALGDLYTSDALLDASLAGGRSGPPAPSASTEVLASLLSGPR